jgi:hypothetical protein
MEFGDAFDALMDESNYMDAAQVLAGLAGSVVARNGVDSRVDLPDEVYGLGVAGGAAAMGYPMVAIGGMSHTGIKLAERAGFKSTVEQAGQ